MVLIDALRLKYVQIDSQTHINNINKMPVTMFAQPLPVISEESIHTALIEGRKLVLKTKK